MTMVVWKFAIERKGTDTMIRGIPLHIGIDHKTQAPAVWCLCDQDDPGEPFPMPYVVVMTGQEVPPDAGAHVTTVTGIGGVAHFFRRKEPSDGSAT